MADCGIEGHRDDKVLLYKIREGVIAIGKIRTERTDNKDGDEMDYNFYNGKWCILPYNQNL